MNGDDAREIAELRARVAELERRRPTGQRHWVRPFFAVLLIIVAAVLTPLSAVAAWSSDLIGDTDRYVSTMKPLASDPDVQEAVADRVTKAVMQHVDIESLLTSVAPADRPRLTKALGPLSGPITSGLTDFVHSTADKFVSSDAFATLWTDLNRTAHASVDKALTGKGGGAVKLTNDAVVIDLAPVIDRVKQALVDRGLGIAAKIPEVHTDFTVMTSDSIGKAKKLYRLLQIVGFWLPVLTLVLAAGGVLLAIRRRRALVTAALAVAAGAAVLGIALWIFRGIYLDGLPSGVSQPAAGSVFDTLVRFLRTTVRMVITLGIVVALAAWLTGSGRAATRVLAAWRGGIGAVRNAVGFDLGPVGVWVHRAKTWLNWTVVAVAAVTLLIWNYPTAAVTVWIAVVALLVLAVVEFLDDDGAPHLTGTTGINGTTGGAGGPAAGSGPVEIT
ncbi:hypothetical protein OOK06_29460 [Streptomyces sp. NBC_00340]|uniref:hypothetical protein n=1 Tax=Streptomyces sp. NBC_00340 TaxID=2975716 RepID=UPI002259896E|nr:hypothetical protein [Streptomyces sp. NBC_00340]MCX5136203.1 hypothetical protein [Streptomyces sp. NBC_00340]